MMLGIPTVLLAAALMALACGNLTITGDTLPSDYYDDIYDDVSSCTFEDFQKQKTRRHKRNVEECTWIVKGPCYPKNPPIIVNEKDQNRLLLPLHEEDGKNRVRVKVGEKLFLWCSTGFLPHQKNKFNNKDFDTQYIEATCENDGDLHVNGKGYNINMLGCEKKAMSFASGKVLVGVTPMQMKPETCGQGNSANMGFIGFIAENFWVRLINVCFQYEQNEKTTIWSKYTLRGLNIAAADTERLKVFTVDPGHHYSPKVNKKMDALYSHDIQKNYLMTNGINQEILWENLNQYTRGHLANRDEFVSQVEADATFHYQNILPQWLKYNVGNWRVIEKWVVNLAKKLGHDLEIYTGGHSVVDLKYKDTNLTYYLGNIVGFQEMGVPAAFWKLVIDYTQDRAVVFIINNNPLENEVIPGIKCNEETCKKLTGLKLGNAENGYTLCCELNDPKNTFPPNMPNDAHNFPLLNFPQK